ncbi:MAG TPA: sulfide/dihydroorotate dehydrogenase-like FAD/NAD-binding protein [Candidatus Tidjanibacter faecipullorum]|uniref:Sulfide/dihydroorotate dehydrogenase-like FAD/NAD-binding protein n=1 Tax=Candidatus Tidjanibacter faecipullorum TaxID=2838766 RepID=A0A9D2IM87_9BACT|nr:sulfide/dihydroorotate dehydrogenase-like FAD/NAD-binding protein [Candidatus Tidjanibacter faecipullorum]
MFRIVEKRLLAPDIWLMNVEAPRVAHAAQPGQFVIVRGTADGERIPLTVADYDREKGTVCIVIQAVGASTRKMVAIEEGGYLVDFAGPLGQPSEFVHEDVEVLKKKRFLFIAGGVGAAPVYPQVKWMHEHGIAADVIVGARNRDLLILTDELRQVAGNLYLSTDDGSEGFHGNVTALMKDLIDNRGKHYDEVITIGPMIMMKFVALATKEYGIKTIASLNTLMIDGTGMCGACRVSVGGKMRFACVEGPEFDAALIDFDEAMRRQRMYRTQEQEADHRCRIGRGK